MKNSNPCARAVLLWIVVAGQALAQIPADFDGDGKPDLIWQNRITGEVSLWLMNGTAFVSSVSLGTVPTEWTIATTGDFNGDGKPDVVWQNGVTGERMIWLMNGPTYGSSVSLGVVSVYWSIVGAGDFNGDGKTDLVWQPQSQGPSERYVWLMNGTAFISTVLVGAYSSDQTIAGTGDFNGDGKCDLVVSNTSTGERAIWLMNDTVRGPTISLGIVSSEWVIVATGDFNGDGKTDLIWSNTFTGERAVWLLNGTTYIGTVYLGNVGLEWLLGRAVTTRRAASDFNSDGIPDLL